jgi:hypothetical protein
MSARIAPEAVAAVLPVADYRLPEVPVREVEATLGIGVQPRNPYAEAARVTAELNGAVEGTVEAAHPHREPVAPAPLPLEQPGADYVRAVLSGELSPRPTSAQELFARVGTGWVPPESEYRLTEKIA